MTKVVLWYSGVSFSARMTSRSLVAGIHRILAKLQRNAQPRSSPIHRYPIWWCLTVAFVLFYIAGANAKGLTISKLPTVGTLSRPSYPILPKTRIPGILYHGKGRAPTMQMVLSLSMVLCSVWFCENYSKLKWPFNCLIQESNPGEYKSTVAREYQVSHAFIDKVFHDKGSSLRQGFAPICKFCLVC